jgi:MFS family permease
MKSSINTQSSLVDTKPFSSTALVSGVISGQIAGLIMAVVVMIVFTILGKGPLYPVQVIGSMALGASALEGTNLLAVVAGLILHQLGPSLLWGVIYGLIATKVSIETKMQALALGLGVGVISMVGPYALIPFLMNALHGADYWNQNVPMFWDWAAHIVFGVSFVIYPLIKNKLSQKY